MKETTLSVESRYIYNSGDQLMVVGVVVCKRSYKRPQNSFIVVATLTIIKWAYVYGSDNRSLLPQLLPLLDVTEVNEAAALLLTVFFSRTYVFFSLMYEYKQYSYIVARHC